MTMTGKTVLVTGAGRGVGRATALVLASRGASLMLADASLGGAAENYPHPTPEDLQETAAQCSAGGPAAVATAITDVRRESDVDSLVRDCATLLGGIDVLVNCAGVIGPAQPAHLLTEADWSLVIDTNLTGAWRCMRAAVPYMIERAR